MGAISRDLFFKEKLELPIKTKLQKVSPFMSVQFNLPKLTSCSKENAGLIKELSWIRCIIFNFKAKGFHRAKEQVVIRK